MGTPGVVLVQALVAATVGVVVLVGLLLGTVGWLCWRRVADRAPRRVDEATAEVTATEMFERASTGLLADGQGTPLSCLATLEDLADTDPTRRQAVVAALCAYLRRAADTDVAAVVRRAVQQTLTRHLAVTETACFWGAQDLYLDGAALRDLDLTAAAVRTLSLRGAQLRGDTTLTGAHIEGPADFTGADVYGALLAADVDLEQTLRCSGTHFAGPVTFRRAVVRGEATFTGAVFAGPADLSATMFRSTTRLDARFDDDACFARAMFADVRLEGIDVAGALDFTDTVFTPLPPAKASRAETAPAAAHRQ